MNKKTIIIIAIIAIAVLYFMFASKEDQQQEQTASNGSWGNSLASSNTSTNTSSSGSSSGSSIATSVIDQKGSAEEKAANINDLLNRFVATCNNHGGIWNPAAAASHPWDTTTLNQFMALSNSSLKVANTTFIKSFASKCVYPENYSSLKSRQRTSLSDAIPTGTLNKYRGGASTANVFKEKMKNLGL